MDFKTIGAAVAVTVLLSCGGEWLPIPGPERRIAKESEMSTTNEIQLIVTLNDSVFSAPEVNASLRRYPHQKKCTEVMICIQNVSESTLLVPFEKVGVWGCGVTDCAQGISLTLGTVDGKWVGLPRTSLSSLRSMHNREYFQQIAPGQTLCLKEQISIFREMFI
jgi:hypothetical protein